MKLLFISSIVFLFAFLSYHLIIKKFDSFKDFLKCYKKIFINLLKKKPGFWSLLNFLKRYLNEKKWNLFFLIKKKTEIYRQKKNTLNTISKFTKISSNAKKKLKEYHIYLNKVFILANETKTKKFPNTYQAQNTLLVNKLNKYSNSQLIFNYIITNKKTKKLYLNNYFAVSLSQKTNFFLLIKKKLITSSRLHLYGEFGNQILHYIYQKAQSCNTQSRMQTSLWIGQEIFKISDPLPEKLLPNFEIDKDKIPENCDLHGTFKKNLNIFSHYKKDFLKNFQFNKKYIKSYQEQILKLKENHTIIVIHNRRSEIDTDDHLYYKTPSQWYHSWLEKNWNQYKNPILYIASDVIQEAIKDFQQYSPLTAKTFFKKNKIQYLPDYYMLTQADVLLISNSTFSFTASLLNQTAKSFFRPSKERNKLIPYIPWKSVPLLVNKQQ